MKFRTIALIISSILMTLSVILLASTVSAWQNTTFNDSVSNAQLNFTTVNENITRWLNVPSSSIIYSRINMFLMNNFTSYYLFINTTPIYNNTARDTTNQVLDSSDSVQPGKTGERIVANVDCVLTNVTFGSSVTATKAYLANSTLGYLQNSTIINGNASFNYSLTAGRTYYILADKEGAAYVRQFKNAITHPYAGQHINFTGGYSVGDSATEVYDIIYVTTMVVGNVSLLGFENKVNNYLSTCSYVSGYCPVPFIFGTNVPGNLSYFDLLFTDRGITENSQTYNTSTAETASENFFINFTYNNDSYTPGAKLWYNGTEYTGSLVSGSGTNTVTYKVVLDIPLGNTTRNFYWNISLNDGVTITYHQSSTNSQNIGTTIFSLCNSTNSVNYINFTFKDEAALTYINGTVPTSDFEYYLGSGTVTKSFIFSNSSVENPSYAFCLSQPNRPVYLDLSLQYAYTSYPQRIYSPPTLSLTNSTTNKILYLLSSSDGIYTTYQVINAAEQPLEGVSVNLTRLIGGETIIIGSGLTGATGTITFWQNPDFTHTANFLLSPYPFYTVTQAFPSTEYTITLGGAGSSNVSDYTKGMVYSLWPTSSYLENGTYYKFNFTISSSYWSLDSYGFNITNEDGTSLGSTSGTAAGGSSIYLNLTTGNNETFYVTYYWYINGTKTSAIKAYPILDTNGAFSIANFVSDLTTYIGLGLFGLDSFGLGLICFFVILGVVGTVKVKSGISNEAVLIGLMFSMVAFFDVGLNLFESLIPATAIQYFPTVLMGLIFVGFLIKEGVQ